MNENYLLLLPIMMVICGSIFLIKHAKKVKKARRIKMTQKEIDQ